MGKLYHCPKMGMKYNTILDPKSGVIQAKQHHLISLHQYHLFPDSNKSLKGKIT